MTLEAWVRPTTVSNAWRDVIEKGNDNYYLSATSISESWASQARSLTKHEAELVAWIMIAAGLLNLRSSNLRRRPEGRRKPLNSYG
jgi:hypothetical protein